MSFRAMRIIDRYVGQILFLLLIPIVWVLDKVRTKPDSPDDVRIVLVQKFLGIGSIINLIPSIRLIRKQFPNAKIIFLTFTQQKEICSITNIADEIITIDPSTPIRFILTNLKTILKLWTMGVDICLNFEFFANYPMLTSCLSGARQRAGFFSLFSLRSVLLTHPANFNHFHHISRNFMAIVEAVGAKVENEAKDLELPSFAHEYRDQLEALIGPIDGPPIIVINPNTSVLCEYRAWAQQRFAEFVKRLFKKWPHFRYVFIGSASEQKNVQEIMDLLGPLKESVFNLAGKTNLKCLLALLEGSDLFLTNDSGPAHIAACYKVNEIVLFGPETPVLYGPLNENCRVIYHPPHCSPCLNVLDNKNYDYCPDVICMKSISVDEVCSAAVDIINKDLIKTPVNVAIN